MKTQYDFSKGKRGPVVPPEPEQAGKTRITIRVDEDIIDYFLEKASDSGGSLGYQTLINQALRAHVEGSAPKFEDTLRRIVREELQGQPVACQAFSEADSPLGVSKQSAPNSERS